jgi:outer membrane protein TolC
MAGLVAWACRLSAAAPVHIDLEQSERSALEASSQLRALRAEEDASTAREGGAFASVLPRVGLDGDWHYVTNVPSIPLGSKSFPFGDYHSYSAGLGASWTFFDLGAWDAWKSLASARRAKTDEREAQESGIRLRTRLAYFQTRLASERVRLSADSLKLALNQLRDIEIRFKAGASSRMDLVAARVDALEAGNQLRHSRFDLTAAIVDFFNLTGLGEGADLTSPMDAQSMQDPPAGIEPATYVLRLDDFDADYGALKGVQEAAFDEANPQLAMFKDLGQSAKGLAKAAGSGYWPRLQAGFRSSYDYPNGPILEAVQQNTTTLGATWSLFNFGQTGKQVREQEAQAASLEARQALALSDLKKEWRRIKAQLPVLRIGWNSDREVAKETQALYELVVASYRNGNARYLEVQSARLRLMEAHVHQAEVETQILTELAQLDALTR